MFIAERLILIIWNQPIDVLIWEFAENDLSLNAEGFATEVRSSNILTLL